MTKSSETKRPSRVARTRRKPPRSNSTSSRIRSASRSTWRASIEEAGKAAAAWAEPREQRRGARQRRRAGRRHGQDLLEAVRILAVRPGARARGADAAVLRLHERLDQHASAGRRQPDETVADAVTPERGDKRFLDPEWGKNAFFDFLKQTYLVTSRWAGDLVEHADGLDERTKHKAGFYVKQIANAISPSNFILTNPELFRETVASDGENLVRGMRMLAEDIQAGKGDLKLRQSDTSRFEVGKNLATTPGKVVGRSDVAEIIQYDADDRDGAEAAAADLPAMDQQVLHPRPQPGKIVHPLGDRAGTHGVRHLLGQPRRTARQQGLGGLYPRRHRVRARHRREGDRRARGQRHRLLRRRHAACGRARADGAGRATSASAPSPSSPRRSTSPMPAISRCSSTRTRWRRSRRSMNEKGYLEGTKMATAFNMLRSGDLIWPYVVNNYMRGKDPLPFDLLYWNAEFDPHGGGQSFLLPAQLLSREQSDQRPHGACRHIPCCSATSRSRSTIWRRARTTSPLPARSSSARNISAATGRVRDGRVRPHRRRRQPAGRRRSTSTGPAASRSAISTTGSRRPRRTRVRGGRTGKSGSRTRTTAASPARKPGKKTKVLGEAPGDYVKVRV